MIFGRTAIEKDILRREEIQRKLNGKKRFAFWPKQLEDGRWVWMQTYYAYYHGTYFSRNNTYRLQGFGKSSWCIDNHLRKDDINKVVETYIYSDEQYIEQLRGYMSALSKSFSQESSHVSGLCTVDRKVVVDVHTYIERQLLLALNPR